MLLGAGSHGICVYEGRELWPGAGHVLSSWNSLRSHRTIQSSSVVTQRFKSLVKKRASEQQLSDEDFKCHHSWVINLPGLYPRWKWRKELVKHSWGEWEIIEKEGLKALQHQVWLFLASNAFTRKDFLLVQIDYHILTQNWGDLLDLLMVDRPFKGKNWLQHSFHSNSNFQ